MNENCLQGIRCPNCGSYGDFWIRGATITADVLMSDDGTVETENENTDWTPLTEMECVECGHSGPAKEFTEKGELL
jgi:DNA-directed RNA polymerase subunit RPC12/RpoP